MGDETPITREEGLSRLLPIKGTRLAGRAEEFGITNYRNKGWFGHVVEGIAGIKRNNKQAPDGDTWELKTTSLKRSYGQLVPKETIAVTMIDKCDVIENDFFHSHLYKKLKELILVVRLPMKARWDDVGFVYSVLDFDLKDEKILEIVKQDYEIVQKALATHGDKNDNDLTCLHSEMGTYVQPRTKDERGKRKEGEITTRRAFYVKKELVAKMLGLEFPVKRPKKKAK